MKVYIVKSCEEFSESWRIAGVFADRNVAVEWKKIWQSREGAEKYWYIEEWEVR